MYLLTYCDCLLTCISEMGKFIIQSCQFLKKLVKSPIFTKLLEKGRHIFDIAYVQCTLLHKSRTLVTVC